jgi:7-cyano-7-deazaguanine tRNA-ribosyltransferase
MQQYEFDTLVDMVMAAKLNLPPDRPLHLFGAGHPMMFAMAVAMGCDIFDSASYALFARNNRYMTVQGTAKLEDLAYFPCNCPTCHKMTPEKVRNMILVDRDRFLASHNLHVLSGELQTIKQAIVDGRLWELVEARSLAHPALQRAFRRMLHYASVFEKETPIRKKRGPLIATPDSLNRPEIMRHQERLIERYQRPPEATTILLLPESFLKPFRENLSIERLLRKIERQRTVHICAYNLAYALVPQELLDVFPLSQSVYALPATTRTINNAGERITDYLESAAYKRCIIVVEQPWEKRIAKFLKRRLQRKMMLRIVDSKKTAEDTLSSTVQLLARTRRAHRIS